MAIEGAGRINDELEVGFDRGFERRWHLAEIGGRLVMVGVVGAALLGLLGSGPLSHATQVDPSGRLSVDYEPVARFGTQTQVTRHVRDARGATETVHLGRSFGEPLALVSVLPTPVAEIARADGIDLVFATRPGGDAMMRLMETSSAVGRVPVSLSVDGAIVRISQTVLP
ncbi:hypothetical protein NFI95_13390 [Acetobacteraceae bacterium KSS8]|uniref:Uncharacterized protein n=1 Tax=Endosaccharibacter trunci TaxID=2812733 RepID=A0ABT1W968_9PROT|nr:hypothetical protein [Acetobacteraceae bacterium KSS8]